MCIDLVISKSQLTVKAQNLEATLLAIILIYDVYVSLPEQNTTRKGRGYENAFTLLRTRILLRTRTLRECNATRVCGQQQ